MKKLVSRILVGALLVTLATFAMAADMGSWTGWITDTNCAAKGATASHAECATKCVKEKGAKWALYDPSTKQTFVLSSKEDLTKLAGKDVTVKGTLNKDTKTIEASSIEAAKK
jgi:hypothetical protein